MLMTPELPSNNTEIFKSLYHQKEMELSAILEITQSINNNASEESLYTMYKFTLRGNLQIEKLALFVLDERWNCKVNFGTKNNFFNLNFESYALQSIREQASVASILFDNEAFWEFDLVIPVFHKDNILAYIFLNQFQKTDNQAIDTRFVHALTNIILVAIENKKLVRRQLKQEAFNKEMEIAKQVQSLLFPKKLPYSKEIKIKATYFPHDLIGGDYYDYIPLSDDKFIFCIADVSGKGVPAALLMSNFQASLRTLTRQTENLKQIVEELNHAIYQNAGGEHFITFFIALFDKVKQAITYINAGHNPAFLFDYQANRSYLLDIGSTVLGVFSPLPFLKETTINNMRNFFLFNYTDGVTETINPEGEQYGIDRLLQFLKTRQKTELNEIHSNLMSKINLFKKENAYTDDITLLSCRVEL